MSKPPYSTEGFSRSSWRIDGVETVVYEIGEGDPLVYFHGGGTHHGFEWARSFADSFRVILPYHPNFGESEQADLGTVCEYMLHYEMLFPALELEQFHLMGSSMGGHFAARYAGAHAEEIEKLVLISPAGLKSDLVSIPNFSTIPPDELPGMFVTDPDFIKPFWPADPSPEWLAMREKEQEAAYKLRQDPNFTDPLMREALDGFDRPTLILWGDNDRIVPVEFVPEWQQVLPRAELSVIENGSHLLLDEFPEACAAAKAFLLS